MKRLEDASEKRINGLPKTGVLDLSLGERDQKLRNFNKNFNIFGFILKVVWLYRRFSGTQC